MMDLLSERLGAVAGMLDSNKYLSAIKNSFTFVIALTIVGSIGTLLGSVICSPTNGLAQYAPFAFLADYADIFTTMNDATTNIISVLVAYNIGFNLARSNGREGHFEGLVSVCALVCAAPFTVTKMVEETKVSFSGLSSDVTASKGLFVAMLVGMIAIEVYCKLASNEKLEIRMPDAVPENVSKSFSALIPTTIVLFGVSLVSFIIRKISSMYLSEVIYKLLAVPVSVAFQNPVGIILCAFIAALFWICGLHGATIVRGITNPITLAATQTNADLVLAGLKPTEIVTSPFWNMYVTMGGFGCTISLLLAIFIASKREDDRAIAKLSIAPGCFGINEPVIFGLPIVLNPILAIPFILSPVVSAAIGYFMTAIGFAGKAYVLVPWCMPPVINGFLATGGNVGAALTQVLCIVVCTLIYLPFVRIRSREIQE